MSWHVHTIISDINYIHFQISFLFVVSCLFVLFLIQTYTSWWLCGLWYPMRNWKSYVYICPKSISQTIKTRVSDLIKVFEQISVLKKPYDLHYEYFTFLYLGFYEWFLSFMSHISVNAPPTISLLKSYVYLN